MLSGVYAGVIFLIKLVVSLERCWVSGRASVMASSSSIANLY